MGSKNANKKNNDKSNEKKKKNKTKNNDNSNSNPSAPNDGNVINDPRFSSLHTDPRFREAPKHKTQVVIDSRFDRMFTDNSFLPSSAPVDKRGKPRNKRDSRHASLRHYYKIEEEKEKREKLESESEDEDDDEEEEGSVKVGDDDDDEGAASESSESISELESDTDTDTDDGAGSEGYDVEEPEEKKEEVLEIEKETHRLAVVDMDWRYVKAADLYVLLSSFVPPNGLIKSVAIYPSEFGLQRMKEEEVKGPVGLFDDENENSDDSRDDDLYNEKLRAYEKSRMRYYYAVVECDSSATADYIYKECDGLEFMQSSNALDLRFIPDSMELKHAPRDVATEAPANYECKDFYSRALQHSKVNLSWDEDEPLRVKTLKRKLNDEQLAQLELNEFLNSDESESDDDGEDDNGTGDQPNKKAAKREKYRALLQSGDGSDGESEHDDVQDMEVTFNTGLEDISKHILEKKDKKSETVWEAYLRKRREKKMARKNKSKKYSSSSDDDNSDDPDQEATKEADDFFIDEPAVKKRKKVKSKSDEEHKHEDIDGVDKASKEELELLLADDKGTDAGLKGYNLKFKKSKGKRKENAIDEDKIPSSAFDDPRFEALFKPEYAIDPTDPQFKRSAAYLKQQVEKQKKGSLEWSAEGEQVKTAGLMKGDKEGSEDVLKSKKDKDEFSSLVKSLKMKTKEVQLPLSVKRSKDGKSLKKH